MNNLKIQSIHFDADDKLLEFIRNKVSKLSNHFDGIHGGEVFLRLDKSKDSENKIAEIRLFIPGNDLFTKRKSKTFEQAADDCIVALKNQARKHKEKMKRL